MASVATASATANCPSTGCTAYTLGGIHWGGGHILNFHPIDHGISTQVHADFLQW